jgi:hypothetical protein
MLDDPRLLFVFAFPPLLLIAMAIVFSAIGGWRLLARTYPLSEPFPADRWRFQSARMRYGVAYNGGLNVGADRRGLYISILFLLRGGHPPLFIPWPDVSISSEHSSWFAGTTLRFKKEPGVPFRISETLAQRLRVAAGSSWPQETTYLPG